MPSSFHRRQLRCGHFCAIVGSLMAPVGGELLIVMALLSLWAPLTAVELSFKTPIATFTAPVEVSGHQVAFEFTNTSSETITVTDIQTGCGCVTSALEKRIYQPGESGTLQTYVDFQERTGPIKKLVRIKVRGASDTIENEQRLKIDGIALTPLALSDLTVSWAIGETTTAKEIIVSIKDGHNIADLSVEGPDSNPHFRVEAHKQTGGGLLVRITPHPADADDKVSLASGRGLQQPYLLIYKYLPTGMIKHERFYAIIYSP